MLAGKLLVLLGASFVDIHTPIRAPIAAAAAAAFARMVMMMVVLLTVVQPAGWRGADDLLYSPVLAWTLITATKRVVGLQNAVGEAYPLERPY